MGFIDRLRRVYRRTLRSGKYGFQGWSVEEVLKDVMGMDDTRTDTYKDHLMLFEKSIDDENYLEAEKSFNELDHLLHPDNNLRKLLRLELASVKGMGE